MFYADEANALATQILCKLWSLIERRKYQLVDFDPYMRESIALFNFKEVKSVLESPSLAATRSFYKLNHIPFVDADQFTGNEAAGTIVLVPGFSLDGRTYCLHAVTSSPHGDWFPRQLEDPAIVSFLEAYSKVRHLVTKNQLTALQAELKNNRVETPRPSSAVTPGDASLVVREVIARVIKAKNGAPVAYDILSVPNKTFDGEGKVADSGKREWILAVCDGVWTAVKTDQNKVWAQGETWKPVYVPPVSVSEKITQIVNKQDKLDTTSFIPLDGKPDDDDEYWVTDPSDDTDPEKAYKLADCLFSTAKFPGKSWRVDHGKIVNIDLQFKVGPVGLSLLRRLYPKEISYAEAHPYAGYFIQHYGHPSLRYLVNHLTVVAFARAYRHQECSATKKPALVADCGSKYHQLVNMLPTEQYTIHAYRPEIFPYDIAYNEERRSVLPKEWLLYTSKKKHSWNKDIELPKGADITAIDTIYYPGVRSAITNHLHNNPRTVAHVVFTAYSQIPGHYSFVDGEGSYCVYEKKLKVPSITGKKTELWVLNMPSENQDYEHPLFDYSPYAASSTLDVNGIFWKEIASFDIGNQARLVYVELTSVHKKLCISEDFTIGHENMDDMTRRYMKNEEYYGQALSYFNFKKLSKITPLDRKSAVNYVLSKLQIFSVTDMQYEMAIRNTTYAAFDYIEKEKKEAERIRLAETPLETTGQRYLRERLARLTVELPSLEFVQSIEFQLCMYLTGWFVFHAIFPYYYFFMVVLGLWSYLVLPHWFVPYVAWAYQAAYPALWIIYCSLYGGVGLVIIHVAWKIRSSYYETYTRHPSMARYVQFKDVVQGIVLKDLNEDQLRDLRTPYNKSLKISLPLTKVLNLAHAIVTHFVVPQFVHSGFEFTSEFVRTTPSMMKKTVVNTLHALFVRQCGHYHRADKVLQRKFIHYAQGVMDREIIPQVLQTQRFYSMEEHLNKYDSQKRLDYQRYWADFNENFGIKLTAECMQKGNELSYLDAPKPRFLFNPSGSLKVLGTYMNAYYLDILMSQPWLGVGLNTQQTADRIAQVRRPIRDSIPVTWDGSNHDGHQYQELIDGVDGYFFKKTFAHVLPYLTSLPPGLYSQYMRILVASSTKFFISYKRAGVFIRLINGVIKGTTFSGHPTRTTLGNSLRVYLYARFVAARAGVPVGVIVAGDDVLCFVSRKQLPRFRNIFWACYIDGAKVQPKEKCTHGLGQVAKDYTERFDQTIDFLSKYGMIYHDEVIFNRRIERALLSGNDTMKVNKKFTIAHYNWSITQGLASWARCWPVISKYVKCRVAEIAHWTPTKWTPLSRSLKRSIREMFGYTWAHQVNHYDYTKVSDSFYLMFNPYVIGLMEDDIRFSPQYLDMLYTRAPLKNSSLSKQHESTTATLEKTKTTCSQPTRAKTRSQTKAAGAA